MFEKFGLSQELLTVIRESGFAEPTEIQSKSIPHIMEGKDVIGESATGSGKTLAFGCGIVEHVVSNGGLQALILTPTRELAEQVKESLRQLSHKKHLNIMTIYGGVSIGPQIHGLSRADVVVATPGRLLDHLQRRTIDMSKIKLLVLDEADRMFDMGFMEDVERIIRACPAKRQTLCFSATISSGVKEIANHHMARPILVSAKKYVDPSKLKQVYYNIEKNMQLSLLVHLLQHEKSSLVMVFCNSRRTVDFVVKNLRINRINAIAIHGGLSQNKRTNTMRTFNQGDVGVLVCTDVASRGLHIEDVSHIYNYEIPKDAKDYVHRIGRTARAGEEGKVINLLCDFDHDNFTRVLSEYREFIIEKMERPYIERVMAVQADRGDDRRGNRRTNWGHNRSGDGRSNDRRTNWGHNRRGSDGRSNDGRDSRGSGGSRPFRRRWDG